MKRALIVGAGASGFLHALALRAAGVRIAAVFDPDGARAEWLSGLTGARAIDTLDADVQIAAICSPPHLHLEQARILTDRARLVFVEKPVAISTAELAELERLPNLVPIFQWRAGIGAQQLRAALADERFGPRTRIDCELRLWRDDAYFAARFDWGCSALLSIGIHAIDLVLWAVGRSVVHAECIEWRGRSTVTTTTRGELLLEFDDQTVARIRITLDAPKRNDVHLVVRGARASAELRGGEGDPTARPLSFTGTSPPAAFGATGPPLLVPYVRDALAGRAPSIRDVVPAHALALSARVIG